VFLKKNVELLIRPDAPRVARGEIKQGRISPKEGCANEVLHFMWGFGFRATMWPLLNAM
jgi:hypothetical protein